MKILFVERGFANPQVTGPSRHLGSLAHELSNRGHDVTIICGEAQDSSRMGVRISEEQRFRVIQLRQIGFGPQALLKGLMEIIRDSSADIVHAQGYRNSASDIAALACFVNRVPFVLSPRGSLRGYRMRATNSLIPVAAELYDLLTMKATLRIAEGIAVTSEIERKEALSIGIKPNRIFKIPHGAVFPTEKPRVKALGGNPKLLSVSRITTIRNLAEIIKSINLLISSYPDIRLYLVGDPIPSTYDSLEAVYHERLKNEIQTLGLDKNVKLVGGVYGDELWEFYVSCDLFLCASSYENFGLSLLEAAHFGLPIVSTDVGIASDLIGNGKGGILLPSHEPAAIAKAVSEILRNPSAIQAMREYLKSLSKEYSVDRDLDGHLRLYQEVIESMHR